MTTSLQDTIHEHMVLAMKNKESLKLSVLRGLIAMCTQELTSTRRRPEDKLSDDEVLALIRRAVKQRREAATQFRGGGREDLAKKEEEEALILEKYLPQMMDKEAIEEVVRIKMEQLGATDMSASGRLIGSVMSELKGKADGADVKEIVERLLS